MCSGVCCLRILFGNRVRLLPDQDFALAANRLIFKRMRDLAESGRPIDFTTLPQELDRHKELDLIGGLAYLTSLIDGLPERKNISHYLGILQECAIRANRRKSRRSTAAACKRRVCQCDRHG